MKILIPLCCIFFISACSSSNNLYKGFAKNNENPTARYTSKRLDYSTDTLIIFFDKEIGDNALLEEIKEIEAEVIYRYTVMNGVAIRIGKDCNMEQVIESLRKVKGVLSVEKDYISVIQ